MRAILQKEINLFFSSLIAYISMSVFFIVMGLNLFVFEGNIPDSQYATLDSFFTLAPWVLIFLIPAITHQTGAKERVAILDRFRSGEYQHLVSGQVLNEGVDVPGRARSQRCGGAFRHGHRAGAYSAARAHPPQVRGQAGGSL